MFGRIVRIDHQVILETDGGERIRLGTAGVGKEQRLRTPVLSDEQLARVECEVTEPRNRAILALMVRCGLRTSEIAALNVQDVGRAPEAGGWVHVPAQRGASARRLPIQPTTLGLIEEALAATDRALGGDGPLFLAREGAAIQAALRLTPEQVARVAARSLRVAGVDLSTIVADGATGPVVLPEVFRHTFVARFMERQGRLPELQERLGYSTVHQTKAYVERVLMSDRPGAEASTDRAPARVAGTRRVPEDEGSR